MNKNHGIVRYLEFLVARDGDADLLRYRLSKREAFFDDLARSPVSSHALIDRATYFRNMARRRPEPGLEPRMLWVLATAKANQAERFGVGLTELLRRVNADDPARLHVTLQEAYHTRILADVVAMAFLPQIKVSYDLLDSEVRSAAFVHRSDKTASATNPRRLGR